MGRYAPLRGFKVITADFGLSGTSAESPGGAGDDSVLREWCCLVRWRGSQRQFKLTQLPDGHSLQMVIGTKIGFIRRQTLPEILCHLMNLLVGRQFLQASGALTGCCFRTAGVSGPCGLSHDGVSAHPDCAADTSVFWPHVRRYLHPHAEHLPE